MGVRPGWGLERSRVLQPVGQVELEFRRVGGREATSGKRKKIQAARGERGGARREEPRPPGCGSARCPHDLEGLPLLAGTGTSARGRQCPAPVSPRYPCDPPGLMKTHLLGIKSDRLGARGRAQAKVAQFGRVFSFLLCTGMCENLDRSRAGRPRFLRRRRHGPG